MNREEDKIQADSVKLLSSLGIFCHSVPNEGAKGNNGRLCTMGMRSGVADLVVWWPKGPNAEDGVDIGYVEFKSSTGTQRPAQKTFEAICVMHGIDYKLIRSADEMMVLIKERTTWN